MGRIRGQDRAITQLQRILDSGRLAHAYLFWGPDGVGKTMAAMAFAQAILCTSRQGGDSCGECVSCRKVMAGSHPDLVVVSPAGNSIKIGQVRDLHNQMGLQRFEGRHRVVVIRQAETMTEEAANALLKALEEPVGETVYILVSHNPALLLLTILSRCLAVQFGPLAPRPIRDIMAENGMAIPEVMTRLAGGSINSALDLMQRPQALALRQQAMDCLAGLPGWEPVDILLWVAAGEEEMDLPLFLEWLSCLLRDLWVWQEMGAEKLLLNQDLGDWLAGFPVAFDYPAALDLVLATRRRLAYNVNQRLALEVLLLELNDLTVEKGGGPPG